jgi:2'-5' RNA ligase
VSGTSGTFRAFVAVAIDPAVKSFLLAWLKEAAAAFPGYRFGQAGNLHITLQFLGEVDCGRIPSITAALSSAVEGLPGFRISLGSAGSFPERGAPKILHVTLDQGRQQLMGLADRVRAALSAEGFEPDRPFVPHVTLGRHRGGPGPAGVDVAGRWRAMLDGFRARRAFPAAWDVSHVALMESVLGPVGPTYTARGTAPLAGKRPAGCLEDPH